MAQRDDYGVQLKLHELFHPYILEILEEYHKPIAVLINQKRELGLRGDFSRRLDRALERFASRFERVPEELKLGKTGVELEEIEQRTSIITGLYPEVHAFRDFVCALSECEPFHFPRWWSWLVEDLKAEGLIE